MALAPTFLSPIALYRSVQPSAGGWVPDPIVVLKVSPFNSQEALVPHKVRPSAASRFLQQNPTRLRPLRFARMAFSLLLAVQFLTAPQRLSASASPAPQKGSRHPSRRPGL